jgi:cell division control protein 6
MKTELNEQQLVSKLIDILETKEMSLLIVDHSVPCKKSKDFLKLVFDAQAFLQTRNTNVFVSFLLIIDSNIENWQTDDNYITIFFYPYSKEEVEKIVFDRKDAFKEGAISDEMIKKCITAVPNSISEIFSLLLDATIIAESKNANSVTNEHLDNSLKTRKAETIMGIINILPPSQRIVLLIIATLSSEKKEVHTSEIYSKYVSFCEKENINTLSKPRISQIIGGFEETGILTRKVSYEGIPGRLSIITLNIQSEYLREMLSEVSK